MTATSEAVFWENDSHLAWSSNDGVRQKILSAQQRKKTQDLIRNSIVASLTILCTIASGDWSTVFIFLILFAGISMIIQDIRGV